MDGRRGGLRIGSYRLTPLGMGVFGAIILVIVVLAIFLVVRLFTGGPDSTEEPGGAVISQQSQAPSPDPSSTPEATAAPTPAPTLKSATIRSLGEIIMDNNILFYAYDKEDTSFDFYPIFTEVTDTISGADYTVANVEGAMGGTVNGTSYGESSKLYNTPPETMTALQAAGVDMLTLANDHALDVGFDGLLATIEGARQTGLSYVGAAASKDESETPVIKQIQGINVAFLNYTSTANGREKKASTAATEYGLNLITKSTDVYADVNRARSAGADIIVVYMSWGEEYSESINSAQQTYAQVLVDAGVDVIIGFHPRVLQKQNSFYLEKTLTDGTIHRTLCIGSLGTFLSDSREKKRDSGIVFEFTIQETAAGGFEIVDPTIIPTYVWRTEPEAGKYEYKVLACGDWLAISPEGMSNADYTRLKEVWNEAQATLSSAEISTK